jgi:hypothetical protein
MIYNIVALIGTVIVVYLIVDNYLNGGKFIDLFIEEVEIEIESEI